MTAKPISRLDGNPRKPAVDAAIAPDDQVALYNAVLVAAKYARSATDRATVKAAEAATLRYGFSYNTTAADVAAAEAAEPLPVVRPGLGFTDADAARFAARAERYARQYLGGGGVFPASIPAIKAALAGCALPPRDEWMGEIGAAIARLAPEYEADARDEALRGRIAFEVTVRDVLPVPTKGKRQLIAECAVRIPHAGADYRTGRAIVYQLAAKVEALAPRETWAMDVDVELAPGGAAAETGLRGHVRIWATDGGVPHGFARQHLHTAAAAVLPEIRTVI